MYIRDPSGEAEPGPAARADPEGDRAVGLPDNQHRNGAVSENFGRRAAQKQAIQAAATMRSHDNQAAVPRLGRIDDGFSGLGVRHMERVGTHPGLVGRSLGGRKNAGFRTSSMNRWRAAAMCAFSDSDGPLELFGISGDVPG